MNAAAVSFLVSFLFIGSGLAFQGEAGAFLFLNGKVERPDSTPPLRPLRVDFLCAEKVQQQTLTNNEGVFSFQVGGGGQQRQALDAGVGRDVDLERSGHWNGSPDASGTFVATKFRTFKLSSCKIRLTPGQGYSGTVIQLESRSIFDDADVGVITLNEELSERSPTVSVTTLAAPEDALSAFRDALTETGRERPDLDKVEKHLKEALDHYPQFAEAWQMLGDLRHARRDLTGAEEAFSRAFELDAAFIKPTLALARLRASQGNWPEAATFSDRALELDPDSTTAAYFSGLSHFQLGHPEQAEAGYRRLRDLGGAPDYPVSMLHLAMIYTRLQHLQEAADAFRDYLEWMPEEHFPPGQQEQIKAQLEQWKSQGIEPTPRPADAPPEP